MGWQYFSLLGCRFHPPAYTNIHTLPGLICIGQNSIHLQLYLNCCRWVLQGIYIKAYSEGGLSVRFLL